MLYPKLFRQVCSCVVITLQLAKLAPHLFRGRLRLRLQVLQRRDSLLQIVDLLLMALVHLSRGGLQVLDLILARRVLVLELGNLQVQVLNLVLGLIELTLPLGHCILKIYYHKRKIPGAQSDRPRAYCGLEVSSPPDAPAQIPSP